MAVSRICFGRLRDDRDRRADRDVEPECREFQQHHGFPPSGQILSLRDEGDTRVAVDNLFFFLAAAIFMVIEARGLSGRTSWAESSSRSSVTFPLFLIARELRLADSHTTHLRAADTIPLALLAAFVVGLAIWVDVL